MQIKIMKINKRKVMKNKNKLYKNKNKLKKYKIIYLNKILLIHLHQKKQIIQINKKMKKKSYK